MSSVLGFLSAAFWGLVVLSVLVFVHEGGHYLAARAFRVRATEFFLGLPCRLKLSVKSRSVGTEFGVTPVLLGGYTRICGMEGGDDELLAPALDLVNRRGRVSAREVADELGIDVDRAYDLLATLSDWASIRPYYDPALGEHPGQAAYPESFETPARDANNLTEYDRGHDFSAPGSTEAGMPHDTGVCPELFLEQERSRTYLGAGTLKRVCMLAAGPLVNIALAFVIVTCSFMAQEYRYVPDVSTVGGVEEGTPAAAAGLEEGDVITAVGDAPVSTWTELVDELAPYLESGADLDLTVERDGRELTVLLDLPDGEPTDAIGIRSTVATFHLTPAQAAQATLTYTGQVASYVAQLLNPSQTMEILDQSSSIVGISAMASEAASTGLSNLLLFAAAISMSLGFMNLIPLPPFDGGKILIELVQLVIRRPLSPRVQNGLSYLGLGFMIFVFVVVLKNDIVRFVIG